MVWAVPDYVAHTAGEFIPNDPGTSTRDHPWRLAAGAMELRWGIRRGCPRSVGQRQRRRRTRRQEGDRGGARHGRGVCQPRQYRRSPDFSKYAFVKGYDFIDHTPYPNDRNGHGTFVAGTIAEATNNHLASRASRCGADHAGASARQRRRRRSLDDRRRGALCRKPRRAHHQYESRVLRAT